MSLPASAGKLQVLLREGVSGFGDIQPVPEGLELCNRFHLIELSDFIFSAFATLSHKTAAACILLFYVVSFYL
jgi:hypothetical protein